MMKSKEEKREKERIPPNALPVATTLSDIYVCPLHFYDYLCCESLGNACKLLVLL